MNRFMSCPGQCVPQRSILHVPQKTADKPVGDSLMCVLCMDVMKQMKEAMADNKLQVGGTVV